MLQQTKLTLTVSVRFLYSTAWLAELGTRALERARIPLVYALFTFKRVREKWLIF